MTPMQLTLALLRKQGYIAAPTERWNQFAKVRQDLFGFIDVLAVKEDKPGVSAYQCTTRHNMGERFKKVVSIKACETFLKAGNTVCVIGWQKGKKNWEHELVEVKLDDLEEPDSQEESDQNTSG